MATNKDIKKGYCDDVYSELACIKDRLTAMKETIAQTYGTQISLAGTYDRHITELIEQIDWKLQILSHACPSDWVGSEDFEDNGVSVGPAEGKQADFPGGYLGG